MARLDPHSYADDTQAETASLSLTARVDFTTRTLDAEVTLTLKQPSAGAFDLDTRDLAIEAVTDQSGVALAFVQHPAEPILGARLTITLPRDTLAVTIRYRTSPEASALQWLDPAQTSGGTQPFLFSQCQAIHARSVVPLQDTPRLRITYTAKLTVPRELTAVMAAAHLGRELHGATVIESFEMPQPIPPYLIAFAVGDLASRDLSPRSRVWAEPAMLDRAAHEFAGVEAMIVAAEAMFGPYDWERFDILAMPPSFPYGGMENPRLTFITPTIIAGDRSLVSVIAHELAHSWTGNLVTNANADHFWLNEGFTVYAEQRILETLDGLEISEISAAIGRRELEESIERFAATPGLTRLHTHLEGIDPDEAFSHVPYQKGYLFLRTLEETVGRDTFVTWLRNYLHTFRFGAITTADFEAHFEGALPGVLAKVNAREWIDGEGIPVSAPKPQSTRLAAIEQLGGSLPDPAVAARWIPVEWWMYLEAVPRPASHELCVALDQQFKLTASTNYEVLVGWLTLALQSGHHAIIPRVEEVLASVGRLKFLRSLYTALAKNPVTLPIAERAFERNRAGYHPISRQLVEGVLRQARGLH